MSDKHDELEEGKAAHDASGAGNEYDANKKGEDFAKPTGKKANKQGKADANKAADPKAETVATSEVPGQGGAQRGMKEAVAAVFEGADLSEDFVERAEAIFESSLNERVAEVRKTLEEQFEERLEEELEGAVNELVEKIDDYLDYAVSHYVEENALAIEAGIQVEVAESFMDGLKTLFVEHNVDIDDEKIDVVSTMAEEIEELEAKLNEAIEENIGLSEDIKKHAASEAFAEVAENLTMSEVERFSSLVEDFDYSDLDSFKRKLAIVKENHFGSNKVLSEEHDEEPIDIAEEKYVDPSIAAVAAAISKSVNK